jgi:hypothetical protein
VAGCSVHYNKASQKDILQGARLFNSTCFMKLIYNSLQPGMFSLF